MRIKNYMELAVKSEVNRHREEGLSSDCWCSLCETDVTALALTSLPPLYCMEHSYGMMGRKVMPGTIRGAVQKAASRVKVRPKHRPGSPDLRDEKVRLANFAFEEGSALVRSVLMTSSAPCSCHQCQADTLAFALNRFPPRYGVMTNGHTRFPDLQREFIRHELELLLTQAARIVAARPHH
jgi:competence protein ComFB